MNGGQSTEPVEGSLRGDEQRLREFFVYIMSNRSYRTYIGVTNDLERRVYEHKHKLTPGFTTLYNFDLLVYVETFFGPDSAILREKQLKGWSRGKKLALIKTTNPTWRDLSARWYDGPSPMLEDCEGRYPSTSSG